MNATLNNGETAVDIAKRSMCCEMALVLDASQRWRWIDRESVGIIFVVNFCNNQGSNTNQSL